MKICVVGTGYVGFSLAVLISQKHEVVALDISKERIEKINKMLSPVKDKDIESYLRTKKLNLFATLDKSKAFKNAKYIVIATPTNYNSKSGTFDTSTVQSIIKDSLRYEKNTTIVIKSTVPFGFTDKMRKRFKTKNIFFSPEFLRETKALYDNLYPSRVVVGDKSKTAKKFGEILINCSKKKSSKVPLFLMESREAESVKLFSNTFLAMRVAFFNELDSFAEFYNLSSVNVINGISSDSRIGNYYNNPSFGYGGYCLPKDTKQLLENFKNVPNKLIKAVVDSNKIRKDFIINRILNKRPKSIGIYRLVMKKGSDNFRESAVLEILRILRKKRVKIFLYEPFAVTDHFNGVEIIANLNDFIRRSDLILANRASKDLDHIKNKVYTRDIFREN